MEKKRKNKGITLLALVITIIVLLILAGITISSLIGENGLITRAKQATTISLKTQYFEEINIEILDEITQRNIEAKEIPFITSIQERLKSKDWVKQVSATDKELQKHENDIENNLLTIVTKENYEILIDVENDTLNVNIRDTFEKVGNMYKIKYDANGGKGVAPEEQETKAGFSVILNNNTYTKENYVFVGWSENKNGTTSEIYLEGSEYIPNKNTTLYAIWTSDKITITFDKNNPNATGTMEEAIIAQNVETTLTKNKYELDGYTFVKWNTEADGTGTDYSNGAKINFNKDTTLYAIWEQNVTLTVNINTGKELTSETEITIGATALGSGIESISIQGELKNNNTVYVREIHNEKIENLKTINKNIAINDLNGSIFFSETYEIIVNVKTTSNITKKVT